MPRTLSAVLFSLITLQVWSTVSAQSYSASSHGNRANLPSGCASCHQGHGITGTAMLKSTEEETCYSCHGNLASRNSMIQRGQLSSGFINMEDISLLMRKKSIHFSPTFEAKSRMRESKNQCSACHNPHYSGSPNPYQGLAGITLEGANISQALHEYEVCFRCHSQLSGSAKSGVYDIRLEFDKMMAVSSHPIDRAVLPAQSRSVSLIDRGREYVLTCSTCHGNSDAVDPRGLHGSDYPYLLKKNLEISDYALESVSGAELCYSCHERDSIMGNKSFPYHAEHLNGMFTATPCITCHSGHGSLNSSFLISFDPAIVAPTQTGLLNFDSTGKHSGICYLKCHSSDHNGWTYRNEESTTTAGHNPLKLQDDKLKGMPRITLPGKEKKPRGVSRPRSDREEPEIPQ